MEPTVGVVGAGSWGTTLAKVLGDNGRQTLLWARDAELCRQINESRENPRYLAGARLAQTVEATAELQRICERCDLILLVVPSHGLRQVARAMGDHLHGGQMLVHCTKGIERETGHAASVPVTSAEGPCPRGGGLGVFDGHP